MHQTNGRTTFSANAPHQAVYIVYINGIEVPTKSVNERFGVWQIPEMVVELAPDPILQRLGAEDRVQVAVFDLDDVAPDPSVAPQFRLFGEGEIVAWGYRNTKDNRSIIFTVVNQFAIFTQLFVQFLLSVDDMLGFHTRPGKDVTVAANTTSELIFPFSLFKKGLLPTNSQQAPSNNALGQDPDSINRPFDFLYNVVRNMCGPVPAQQQSVPAANFFARWARLTNFINRFAGVPAFDEPDVLSTDPNKNIFPILKALQTTSAVDVIAQQLIGQVQNVGSIFDMLRIVYQTVFMEIAMLPTMPLVSVDLKTSIVQETKFEEHNLTAAGGTTQFQSVLTEKSVSAVPPNPLKPNRMQNYFAKPQLLFGIPPTCNVFFPSHIIMMGYDENYATQPTRLYFNDEVLNKVLKIPGTGLGEAIMNSLSTAYPPEADAANKARKLVDGGGTGKNFLLFPEEFFKGPVLDRRPIPPWLYFLRQSESTQQSKQAIDPITATTEAPPGQQDLFEKLRTGNPDVYRLYAEYEYFRERFSRRGGTIISSWNPYVVPGFPMAAFDQRASRCDVFGYVTTVQLGMTSKGQRQTVVSYTYGRTVQEMFDILALTFAEGSPALGAGPREPVREIRQVIQSFTQAEKFYQKLFYGDRALFNKPAAFDWRDIIAYAPIVAGEDPETIFIEGGDEATLAKFADAGSAVVTLTPQVSNVASQLRAAQAQLDDANKAVANLSKSQSTVDQQLLKQAQTDQASAQTQVEQIKKILTELQNKLSAAQAIVNDTSILKQSEVTHNLDGTREIVPALGAEKYFELYDEAIKYSWRPRCTLEEYIIFYNSAGEGEIPAYRHPRSLGARYFERIRRLRPLTAATTLPTNADGLGVTTVANPNAAQQSAPQPGTGDTTTPAATKTTVPGLDNTFPQTRADWDTLLLRYRDNVYNVLAPRT